MRRYSFSSFAIAEIVWALIVDAAAAPIAEVGIDYSEPRSEEEALREIQAAVAVVVVYDKKSNKSA